MTDREIFEKETGKTCNPYDALFYWMDYAKWLEKRSEWVSVEDRLPKVGLTVYLFKNVCNCPLWYVGFLGRDNLFHLDSYNQEILIKITHWKEVTLPDEARRRKP